MWFGVVGAQRGIVMTRCGHVASQQSTDDDADNQGLDKCVTLFDMQNPNRFCFIDTDINILVDIDIKKWEE